MSKGELILGKIHEFVKAMDPSKRTMGAVIQWHFSQNGAVVKTLVLDFKNIKFYEGNVVGEETTSEVTIDDDDFCSVFEGKNTFAKLQEAGKVKVVGSTQILERMDIKLQEHGLTHWADILKK